MDVGGIMGTIRARALYFALVTAVIVSCIAVVATDTWRTWERRGATIDDDTAETANLVRSLAQHAHDIVQSVDMAIVALREVAEMEGVNPRTFGRLHKLMQTQAAALPALHVIAVFDAHGEYVADSLDTPHPFLNGSDRAYFKYHASNPDRGAHLGEPVHSKLDGAWILTVSRRIDAPDGSFAGVVVGTISVDAIQSFYATFNVGKDGAIVLMSDTGVLVARKPADNLLVGSSLAKGQFFTTAQRGGATGSFDYVSAVDGVTRLGSYQRVSGFPLLVVASHGLNEVLVPWRQAATFHLAVSCVIAGCLGVLGLLLSRQVRRRLAAEASLQINEQHYRMLAENSSDLVVQLDRNLRRVYVSPTSRALLGYEPRELLGRTPSDIAHPEDWPALSASLAAAGPDGAIMPVSLRVRKWNGTHLWIETAGRKLPAAEGYILTLRDITQRKAAEALLQESNEQVQRLTMIDAVTKVGNKQSFDLALDREYARVERSDRALSLLIIDFDHFSLFHDRLGPAACDHRMRLVAVAISDALAQSSDIVARIGDDEFAVLLPETTEKEAALTAERICEAVRKLNVSIPDTSASSRITVSIGLATVRPRQQAIGPQNLIYAADEALSVAKRAGRDGWHASTLVADYLPAMAAQPPKTRDSRVGDHELAQPVAG